MVKERSNSWKSSKLVQTVKSILIGRESLERISQKMSFSSESVIYEHLLNPTAKNKRILRIAFVIYLAIDFLIGCGIRYTTSFITVLICELYDNIEQILSNNDRKL